MVPQSPLRSFQDESGRIRPRPPKISEDIDLFHNEVFNAPKLKEHLLAAYKTDLLRVITNGVFGLVENIKPKEERTLLVPVTILSTRNSTDYQKGFFSRYYFIG